MNAARPAIRLSLVALFRAALLPLTIAAGLGLSPVPAFSQEEEERPPEEAEDEFSALDGLENVDIPMSFQYRDQPLGVIFDQMADLVGISISYGPDFPYDERVSVHFPNSTLSAALKSLARTHKLRYTREETGALRVDARD